MRVMGRMGVMELSNSHPSHNSQIFPYHFDSIIADSLNTLIMIVVRALVV